ncbi:MAG: globin [Candidatus Heimdallarchaeota archaeon]
MSKLRTVYDLVGGDPFFKDLTNKFYDKIDKDELIRYMFPESLENPKNWNFLFLRKIFGGPDDYIPLRGNPMMRRRHLPFKIGLKERNRWLFLMLESLDELGINIEHKARPLMQYYFEHMATKMINQPIDANEF